MDSRLNKKFPVEKNIFIFTNCIYAIKCAALFELKIQITKIDDGNLIVDSHYLEEDSLEPIKIFYEQRRIPEIDSVAACVLGSKLYLIPHDEQIPLFADLPGHHACFTDEDKLLLFKEHNTLPPCIYDLKNNITQEFPEFPHARKTAPIVTAIGNRIFALSTCFPFLKLPEPCFEVLDLDTCMWETLACPPFYNKNEEMTFNNALYVLRSVVVEESFILFSVTHDNKMFHYSYNIHSGMWKLVDMQYVADAKDVFKQTHVDEKAVVFGNNIYTFDPWFKELCVFSYNVVGDEISLGLRSRVEGLKFEEKLEDFGDRYSIFVRTTTIAKVDEDDRILCLLHTLCAESLEEQRICVTFVQILDSDPGKCTTLKSFTCTLSPGKELLCDIAIKACFVLDDLEKESGNLSGKRAHLVKSG